MRTIKVLINNKTYTVAVAETEEQKETGLQNKKELGSDSGMLFVFDTPEETSIWMKDTEIPLDIIFINDDLEVISTYKGVPFSEEAFTEKDVSFVLEVNQNSGIKKGDEIEFITDLKTKQMLVLRNDGTSQMNLDGGERIFSRPNTKILIKFAKKADLLKRDSDYKALGKRVFKFLDTQDSKEPEYVNV